jgi:hypothetical protein
MFSNVSANIEISIFEVIDFGAIESSYISCNRRLTREEDVTGQAEERSAIQ